MILDLTGLNCPFLQLYFQVQFLISLIKCSQLLPFSAKLFYFRSYGSIVLDIQKKKQQLREEQKEEKRDLEQIKHDVHVQTTAKEEAKKPHSFVIHTGKVGKFVKRLERDLRRVMEPNTASDLHVTKRNNFKDFLVNSQHLGVSHLMVLTRTEQSVNLRIIRNNQGPTLHFRGHILFISQDKNL